MPKLQEAASLVAGTVLDVSESRDYDTKQVDGLRVIVTTGGEGFASVKLNNEAAAYLRPTPGSGIAWYLRPGATGGKERDASTFTVFVREATMDDLDKIAGKIRKPETASAK